MSGSEGLKARKGGAPGVGVDCADGGIESPDAGERRDPVAGRSGSGAERPDADVFVSIAEALDELREGKMVIVCDDEDRENEGDLTMAAEIATAERVNFMAKDGRGLVCLCLTPQRCAELNLPPMVSHNQARLQTAFTVSIEAREGVTTGISAADRAHTIQVAIDPGSRPADLVQPGHVFPLMRQARRGARAQPGRPRPASTSPVSPASSRRGSSARS